MNGVSNATRTAAVSAKMVYDQMQRPAQGGVGRAVGVSLDEQDGDEGQPEARQSQDPLQADSPVVVERGVEEVAGHLARRFYARPQLPR